MTRKPLVVASIAIAVLVTYVGAREIVSRSATGGRLAVRWEGAFIDRNTRDLGESLNACLGRPLFRPGVVHRANVWFSGWSCDGVGNPDVIYSFNFDQKRRERYYCDNGGEPVVGRFFQSDDLVLHDLEFVETWEVPETRAVACAFFRDSFVEIGKGRRILAHCDAGKDRTGTYAALVAALSAELRGAYSPAVAEAIECDYRKSKTLEPAKYGRIQRLLAHLAERGGVARFFRETCGIEQVTLEAVSARFIE